MQDGELISVVIPAYNRERSIARAIAAVLAQTYPRLEIVVVDDASTDGTAARVEAIGDPGSAWCATGRTAAPRRRATPGSRRPSGAFIAFQDSDDDWLPEKLARQAAHMASLPDDYVATFCTKIDYGCERTATTGRGWSPACPTRGRPSRAATCTAG